MRCPATGTWKPLATCSPARTRCSIRMSGCGSSSRLNWRRRLRRAASTTAPRLSSPRRCQRTRARKQRKAHEMHALVQLAYMRHPQPARGRDRRGAPGCRAGHADLRRAEGHCRGVAKAARLLGTRVRSLQRGHMADMRGRRAGGSARSCRPIRRHLAGSTAAKLFARVPTFTDETPLDEYVPLCRKHLEWASANRVQQGVTPGPGATLRSRERCKGTSCQLVGC